MNTTSYLVPAQLNPPGHLLARTLEARNMTQADLAEIMDRPAKTLNAIIQGKKAITAQTAIELENALGIKASFWLNLEKDYQLHLHRKNTTSEIAEKEGLIALRSKIYSISSVREILKKGWVTFNENVQKNAEIISKFVEEDIFSHEFTEKFRSKVNQFQVNFRHSTKLTPTPDALFIWHQRVKHLAHEQGCFAYNPDELKRDFHLLKSFIKYEDRISEIPSFLKKYGVHFVIVPHLQKTYLDGAMIMDQGQAIIALTLRHDRIDNFYFTLFHELGHLLLGHGESKAVFFDSVDFEDGADDKEQAADLFAQSNLLPEPEFEAFCRSPLPFSKSRIETFAAEIQSHSGVVLGQLQYKNLVSYGHQRQMLSKVKPYLEKYIDIP